VHVMMAAERRGVSQGDLLLSRPFFDGHAGVGVHEQ